MLKNSQCVLFFPLKYTIDNTVAKQVTSQILGHKRYGFSVADANTDIREQENSDIWYISQYYIYI